MLKLRYDLSIWESAMFGGGDDPALNFDGTSIYGELTHPVTFTGDFEAHVTFNTTMAGSGVLLGNSIDGKSLLFIFATTHKINATFGDSGVGRSSTTVVNDGLDHVATMKRVGTTCSILIDGAEEYSGTLTLADVVFEQVGKYAAGLYFDGQIKLIKFIDKSGASDVVQTYQINNGSTTSIPIAGGGPEAMTLYNVVGGDWS